MDIEHTEKRSRTRTWLMTSAAAAGIAIGAAGIAGAATGTSTSSAATAATNSAATAPVAAQDPATLSHGPAETVLTGTTADKVSAAALAAVPGGTIIRVETDSAGSPYEAHVKKSDGSQVTVKMDSNFKVSATESGFGPGPAGGPTARLRWGPCACHPKTVSPIHSATSAGF